MSDDSFLKRIGIPASLAAVLSAAMTLAFFMLQVDSRYAKTETLDRMQAANTAKLDTLTNEISRLAGVTQVLIQVTAKTQSEQRVVMRPTPTTPSLFEQLPMTLPDANNDTQKALTHSLATLKETQARLSALKTE